MTFYLTDLFFCVNYWLFEIVFLWMVHVHLKIVMGQWFQYVKVQLQIHNE